MFDNQISKDTDLYRLHNTNIHKKIEMKKKQSSINFIERCENICYYSM